MAHHAGSSRKRVVWGPLDRLAEACKPWVAGWLRLLAPRDFGLRGETAAARYLKRRGHKIVARRHRNRLGELDLVTVEGRTVVFVEVKSRRSHVAGHPIEAISAAKQRKLTQLALAFLKQHGLLENEARFEVVAVTWPENRRKPRIEHFENAFEPVGRGQLFS